MAHNIIETLQYETNVVSPDDGDTASAASVEAGLQDLSNRTNFLRNRGMSGNALAGNGHYLSLLTAENISSRFTFRGNPTAANGLWFQASVADAGGLFFYIPYILGAKFSSITTQVNGDGQGGGPHVGIPGTMPTVALYTINRTTGVGATVGSQADTSAAVGAYDVEHSITLSFAQQTISSANEFLIGFAGETGANSIAGALTLTWIRVDFDSVTT